MSNEEETLVPAVGPSQLAKRIIGGLSGLLFLGGFLATPEALAHAKLIRSRPKPFEEFAQAPAHVELWFNERLEDEFNAIEVREATGRRVENGAARVNPRDRTNLLVGLEGLAPGSYIVQWRVLSLDGHPARGRLLFTVK
ncbi:MAG: copper resistance CopC family protein [Candidatus Methylomirabilis sp.]